MRRLKWGVIGAGGIARRRTIPEVIAHSKRAEIVAVMDSDPKAAQSVGTSFEIQRVFTDATCLLRESDLDVVYVASPPKYHARQVIDAARRGKHVLCEKPLAMNLKECERMIEVCREMNVKLMVAFMMRFQALHVKAKSLVDKGRIGRPVMGRTQLACWYPKIKGAWRQDPASSPGGAFVDMGSHGIDLLEFVLGQSVQKVTAIQNSVIHRYPVEDSSLVILEFDQGTQAVVDNYFNIPDAAAKGLFELYGTLGSLLAEGTIGQTPGGTLKMCTSDQSTYEATQRRPKARHVEIKAAPRPMYAAEVDHLCRAIESGRDPGPSGEVGLHNMRVIEAAYRAARTGKTQRV